MNEFIKEVCDAAAEEAAYQSALKSNEEAFAMHAWIPDPKGLAKKATDAEFNRIPRSQMVPMDWSIFEN